MTNEITNDNIESWDRMYRVGNLEHNGKVTNMKTFSTYRRAKRYVKKNKIDNYALDVIFLKHKAKKDECTT